MTPEDSATLAKAVQLLEHPGFAECLANTVGKPIELIGDALPTTVRHTISTATTKALQAALKVALRTMQSTPHSGSKLVHKVLATASGAAGGAFGLATLPIELPVSTIIMLRSIAEIARGERILYGRNMSVLLKATECTFSRVPGGLDVPRDKSADCVSLPAPVEIEI